MALQWFCAPNHVHKHECLSEMFGILAWKCDHFHVLKCSFMPITSGVHHVPYFSSLTVATQHSHFDTGKMLLPCVIGWGLPTVAYYQPS